jgi:hypothetical protein
MESINPLLSPEDFTGWETFSKIRYLDTGHNMVLGQNFFIEGILKHHGTSGVVSEAVMERYHRPFLNPSNREPIWRFPNRDFTWRSFARGGHVALATLGLVEGWQQSCSKTSVLGRARYVDTTAPSQEIL